MGRVSRFRWQSGILSMRPTDACEALRRARDTRHSAVGERHDVRSLDAPENILTSPPSDIQGLRAASLPARGTRHGTWRRPAPRRPTRRGRRRPRLTRLIGESEVPVWHFESNERICLGGRPTSLPNGFWRRAARQLGWLSAISGCVVYVRGDLRAWRHWLRSRRHRDGAPEVVAVCQDQPARNICG